MTRWLIGLVLVALSGVSQSAPTAQSTAELEKIEWLLAAVEQLPNAVFLRNGEPHSPAEAAAHLRMKWGKAGKRVRTAEDFIRLCASRSYLSGKPYQIRFKGREPVAAGPYLRGLLASRKTKAKKP